MDKKMFEKIPQYVVEVLESLEKAGFEAYLVGGCVRDLLMMAEPKDWDVATNAKPEEIIKFFPDSVYENDFGTVGVKFKIQNSKGKNESQNFELEKQKEICTEKSQYESVLSPDKSVIVEVTTYRIESKYTDKRHPDSVKFAKTLEEDLSRRDFTVNAIALATSNKQQGTSDKSFEIVDLFGGQKDLENKIIRAVGEAEDRFQEDALRMMRAIRFACTQNKRQETRDKKQIKTEEQDNWKIEEKTFEAIKKNVKNLRFVSAERIRDEFSKIILSKNPAHGIELLLESKLLDQFMPEILETIGVKQNRHHYFGPYNTVFAHMLASLEKCPSEKLEVRLASFFHDIGKPKSKRGTGEMATFHSHEYIGAKIVEQILHNLRYPTKVIEKTVMLVKNHMFYYNVDEVGEAGVRRVVQKVGLENINDLIDVRIADRLGSGVAKAVPYKLRHFRFMVEKVSSDAISVKQLKINGNDLIGELKMQPGPKIGAILDVLLSQVIDDATLNEKNKLLELASDLDKKDLAELRAYAKEKIEEERKKEEKLMKGKYWVE